MSPRRRPGELEQEVLACLASGDGPMTPSAVAAELSGELAYTTVMTTLARLHSKRAVGRVEHGRGFAYFLLADEPAARAAISAFQMQQVLDNDADRAGVLAQFVAGLHEDDEAMLRLLLETDDPS